MSWGPKFEAGPVHLSQKKIFRQANIRVDTVGRCVHLYVYVQLNYRNSNLFT